MKSISKYIIIFLALLASWGVAPLSVEARALDKPISVLPQSDSQLKLSYAPLVKKSAPAVVNIYTRRLVRERVSPFMNDPMFRHFFGGSPLFGGMMQERVENSLGSGVIIDRSGLIVTNTHVIQNAKEIVVVLSDGREFEAREVLADERTDLAVLRIEGSVPSLPVLEIGDSDSLEVGDIVLAIGNPFGVGQTVTSGIVSAVARTSVGTRDYGFFIQTDAAINPGNSGGALIDMQGKLIGVNAAIYTRDGGSLGIGFAIPSNMLKPALAAAQAGLSKITTPWIGLHGQAVNADMAESLGMEKPLGVAITSIHAKSPAAAAGVKTGDVILDINGREVRDPQSLRFRLATLKIGDVIDLKVLRKGKINQIRFRAIAPPEDPPRQETQIEGNSPLSGLVVANISPALQDELNNIEVENGVVIVGLQRSRASSLGLRQGDVLSAINDQPIKSVNDVRKAVSQVSSTWKITIIRGKQTMTLMVR